MEERFLPCSHPNTSSKGLANCTALSKKREAGISVLEKLYAYGV